MAKQNIELNTQKSYYEPIYISETILTLPITYGWPFGHPENKETVI